MKCEFNIAWSGKCGIEDCEKHSNLKCCVCGEPATRSCDATSGLICGAALCNNCEEELSPEGTSTMKHCRKSDQKYTPWYSRKDDKKISNDIYVQILTSVIHELEIITFLSNSKTFKDMLNKRVHEKSVELYNYMKNNYPSSIAS